MSQEKLPKLARNKGFCCLWAFLEAHRTTTTTELLELAREAGFSINERTLRYHRRAYRKKSMVCAEVKGCFLLRQSRVGRRTS